MNVTVEEFTPEDRSACKALLLGLPQWFGIAEANHAYIEILGTIPTAIARLDGHIVGFIGLEQHNSASMEIHVLAVTRDLHNLGIGTRLCSWAENCCRDLAAPWLHVKTRGPATPDAEYARTRSFYLARGFTPLFESLTLWGPEDAALILVKKLAV